MLSVKIKSLMMNVIVLSGVMLIVEIKLLCECHYAECQN